MLHAALLLTTSIVTGLLLVFMAAPGYPGDPLLTTPLLAYDTAAQNYIVLTDLAGGRRELRFGDAPHRVWDFSPDGCRVLFTLGEPDGTRLYSAQLDGSDVRSLVQYDATTNWSVWDADYSPTNNQIALTIAEFQESDLPGDVGTHRIALVSEGGSAPIFYSQSGDEHSPRFSPDGRQIVYAAYAQEERDDGTLRPREADLWVVSADGASKFQLTNFPTGSVSLPRWSPDGTLVGFVFSGSANDDQFWMVAGVQGALPTQLSYQPVLILDLGWLPDSSAMLAAAREMQGVVENTLWRIPLIGNADAEAVIYFDSTNTPFAASPRFSAEGRYLALRAAYGLTVLDMEAAGAVVLRVPDEEAGNSAPVWSPVGFAGETSCNL